MEATGDPTVARAGRLVDRAGMALAVVNTAATVLFTNHDEPPKGAITMTDDPATVAATYVRAWKDRDFETLRSILADDVTFTGPLARLDNADACVEGLRGMSQIVTDIVVHKRLADDTDAITWFDLHTSVAPPIPTANWSRVEHGKITHINVAFDARPLTSQGDR